MSNEQLRLLFGVDKDGLVDIEDLDGKIARLYGTTEQTSKAWDGWMVSLRGSQLVTGLNQGLELLAKAKGLITDIINLQVQGSREARSESFFGTQLEFQGKQLGSFLADLESATGGAVDQTTLVDATNKLMQAGVKAEAAATGVALAWEYSQTTGKAFAEGAEKAFGAMAMGSNEAAKALGISINKVQVLDDAARAAGFTFNETGDGAKYLSDEEERLAISAAMAAKGQEKLTASAAGGAVAAEKLLATVENLKSAVAHQFSGGGFVAMAPALAAVFKQTDLEKRLLAYVSAQSELARLEQPIMESDARVEAARQKYEKGAYNLDAIEQWERKQTEDRRQWLAKFKADNVRALTELRSNSDEWVSTVRKRVEELEKLNVGQIALDSKLLQQHISNVDVSAKANERVLEAARKLGDPEMVKELEAEAEALAKTRGEATAYQDAISKATVEGLAQDKERLRLLETTGQAYSEEAIQLRKLLPVMEQYTKSQAAAAEATAKRHAELQALLSMGQEAPEVAFARLTGAKDVEAIREISAAYADYQRKVEALGRYREMSDAVQEASLSQAILAGASLEEVIRRLAPAYGDIDVLSQSIADSAQLWATIIAAIPGQADMSYEALRDIWDELDYQQIIMDAGPGKPPPARTPRGGGSGPSDISGAELESQLRLLNAVDEQARVEAQYLEDVRVAEEAIRKSGGKAINEYVLSIARATKTHQDETRAIEERTQALQRENAERQRQADIDELSRGSEALQRISEARDRLAVLQGGLTEFDARERALDRRSIGADWAEQTIIGLERQELAIERARAKWAGYADVVRGAGDAMQDAASSFQAITSMRGWEGMGPQSQFVVAQLGKINQGLAGVVENWDKGGKELQASGLQMGNAIAATFAGALGGAQEAALGMALWAGATALAMAWLNPALAVQQGAAAAMYLALAGMAGGSKGSRGVSRSLGTSTPTAQGQGGGTTVNIFLTGREIIHGTDEGVGEGIVRAMNKAAYSGVELHPNYMRGAR